MFTPLRHPLRGMGSGGLGTRFIDLLSFSSFPFLSFFFGKGRKEEEEALSGQYVYIYIYQ